MASDILAQLCTLLPDKKSEVAELNLIPQSGKKPRKPHPRPGFVHNVGVNDYPTPVWVDGKILRSYSIWQGMLQRCYSDTRLVEFPAYKDCSVATEWFLFTNFDCWFTENYVKGWQLDKDILVPGNKLYSPDTCIFVSPALNVLLSTCPGNRGSLPLGVTYDKRRNVYNAGGYRNNRRIYLGTYPTALLAHKAWQLAKALIIENFPTTDPRIRKALDLRVAQLRNDHANNRITTKL